METRQLALFVLACQHLSHADAATHAGVSPSSLSEAVSALEDEFGLGLFSRGPLGHAPTENARWLFQIATHLLQLLEASAACRAGEALSILKVQSTLEFMFGRLSRAAALSDRRLRRRHPAVFAEVAFQAPFHAETSPADILLTYGSPEGGDGTLLYTDDWIGVVGTANARVTGTMEGLRDSKLWLPPLAPAQERQIRAYCDAWYLPPPWFLEGDGDMFELLGRKGQGAVMLAPCSLVAAGVVRNRMSILALEKPLRAPVVARILTANPRMAQAARHFVRSLRLFLALPPQTVAYTPTITLRQLRYFCEVVTLGNMTEASRRLNVAQPALSVQLRKLETAMGEPLFERGSHGMKPRSEAEARVELLMMAAGVTERIRHEARGRTTRKTRRIMFGISPLVSSVPALRDAVASALADFRTEAGDVQIRLIEFPVGELHRRLRSGALGLCLCEAADRDMEHRDLAELGPLGMVARNDVGAAQMRPAMTLDQAVARPLVLPPRNDGLRMLLERAVRADGHVVTPAIEVADPMLGLALARSCGFAMFLPAGLLPHSGPGEDMTFVPLKPGLPVRLQALWLARRPPNGDELCVLEHLRSHLPSVGERSHTR